MALFMKHMGVLIDYFPKYWMALHVVQREQHSLRNEQKRLSVLDITIDSSTQQSAFKEGWIVQLGALDAIVSAPYVEDLVLLLLMVLVDLCYVISRFHYFKLLGR
jgi:hypothetical protein